MTFLEVYDGVKRFQNDIVDIVAEILKRNQQIIVDLVKEQLLSGLDADHNLLTPTYLNDEHFISKRKRTKPRKPDKKSAAEEYADKKKKLYDEHNRLKKFGDLFPDKPENTPNLIVSGSFHDAIYIQIKGQNYVIDSTYEDSAKIQRKYNNRVLTLNRTSIEKLTELISGELIVELEKRYG